ncbi:MAG: hypothetical protein IPI64_05920 [Chloracidobacterium sp.]|nr:hypothetical protein [Chloracidobacterium sp.]
MKGLLFLTLVAGLMMALNEGVSAQRGVIDYVNSSSGKLTPVAGENISLLVVTADRDNAEVGIRKGNQICVLNVRRGSEWASVYAAAECAAMKFSRQLHKITYVHNPQNAELQQKDKAVIDPATRSISFSRGSNAVLTLFYEN